MREDERTKKKWKCLTVMMNGGKAVAAVRCARLDECRRGIESVKPNKWECPGYVAEKDLQAVSEETEGKKDAGKE